MDIFRNSMDLSKFKDSGDLFLPQYLRDFLEIYLIGSDKTLFYITNWSVIHLISGIITRLIFVYYTKYSFMESLLYAFIIHTVWELWQYIITNTPHTLRGFVDTIVDTVLFMIGFIIVK
jgi:hypothetical protein